MKGLCLVIILFVAIWMLATNLNASSPENLEEKSKQLLDFINDERESLNISELLPDSELTKLAISHSSYMSETDDYNHSDYPFDENIMVGTDPNEVFSAWQDSSRHHAIMTNPKLRRGAVGMGLKLTNITLGSMKITINTGKGYTTFLGGR